MLGCVLLLTQLSLCSSLQCFVAQVCPVFSAADIISIRYANFVYLGFRRLLAYRHLSAVSSPNSVTIGGKYVCAYSIFAECVSGTGFVASLTAGLNIVPITENSP